MVESNPEEAQSIPRTFEIQNVKQNQVQKTAETKVTSLEPLSDTLFKISNPMLTKQNLPNTEPTESPNDLDISSIQEIFSDESTYFFIFLNQFKRKSNLRFPKIYKNIILKKKKKAVMVSK